MVACKKFRPLGRRVQQGFQWERKKEPGQAVQGEVPDLSPLHSRFHAHSVATCAAYFCAMTAHSKPFVVTRNKCIAPKERRIERLPAGYAVREFYNNPNGCYWYVVTALEVVRAKKRLTS